MSAFELDKPFLLTLAGQCRCQKKKKKKKKRAKRNENKVHNNSVPAPQKIPAMIIWDGTQRVLCWFTTSKFIYHHYYDY